MKNLITVHNYAKLKGKSTTWIYRLIKKGKLQAENIDGVWFVVKQKHELINSEDGN